MKTEIFASYEAFLLRSDRSINGRLASDECANDLDYQNQGCWRCFNCKDCELCINCNDCNSCTLCTYCNLCNHCRHGISCMRCTNCASVIFCTACTYSVNCNHCTDSHNCKDCTYCIECSKSNDCHDCKRCYTCTSCTNCAKCQVCIDCKNIQDAKEVPKDTKAVTSFVNLYLYTVVPRIDTDRVQWVQMGCYLRTREDWEQDFWNNPGEFPDDGSTQSARRKFAFDLACQWLSFEMKNLPVVNEQNEN